MLLTKTFEPAVLARGLAEWPWLDLSGKQPVLTSLFGDVFFASPEGYWYLSMVDGSFTRPWPDRAALVSALDTEQGHDEWLLGSLAMAAEARGVALGADQVYVFAPHPIFTGRFDTGLIRAMDFVPAMMVIAQAVAAGIPG